MMGRNPRDDAARLVGRYVQGVIVPLQVGYCGNRGSSATARADLARLRRAASAGGASWISVGRLVFESWPEEGFRACRLGRADEEKALSAVRGALGLYALHQQSVLTGRAIVRRPDEGDDEYRIRRGAGSFGRACRLIEPQLDVAKGVQRRLAGVEASSDLEGALVFMRALVSQMKSCDAKERIRLDYNRLAQDLFLMQYPGTSRDRVMQRWGKDYYANLSS